MSPLSVAHGPSLLNHPGAALQVLHTPRASLPDHLPEVLQGNALLIFDPFPYVGLAAFGPEVEALRRVCTGAVRVLPERVRVHAQLVASPSLRAQARVDGAEATCGIDVTGLNRLSPVALAVDLAVHDHELLSEPVEVCATAGKQDFGAILVRVTYVLHIVPRTVSQIMPHVVPNIVSRIVLDLLPLISPLLHDSTMNALFPGVWGLSWEVEMVTAYPPLPAVGDPDAATGGQPNCFLLCMRMLTRQQ